MTAIAAKTTTTALPAPAAAKAPRIRKPKLAPVPAPVDELVATVADLDVDFEAAAASKLGYVEFFLKPRLAVQISEDQRTVTLVPFDGSFPDGNDTFAPYLDIEVVPGLLPSYRLDAMSTRDLRFLLARHVLPTLETEADRVHKIAVEDFERAERDAAEFVAGLQATVADTRRGMAVLQTERDAAGKAAASSAAQVTSLQDEIRTVNEGGVAKQRADASTIAQLQAIITRADSIISMLRARHIHRKRRSLKQRIMQVFFPERFDNDDASHALHRIKAGQVRAPEAEALRGICHSQGDLGELALARLKTERRA